MPSSQGSVAWVLAAGLAAAQPLFAQGIYTCVDAKGRRHTSDRPIIDCIDREQKEIMPSGTVLRRIGPSLTADERAAEDERNRRAAEERARQEEEKKRDRALLSRYPDRASHDRERAAALAAVGEATLVAQRRLGELQAERKKLDAEYEFFRNDPKKVPPVLRRQLEESDQQIGGQQRFIASQDDEKKRVNQRYDEELVRLKGLWAQRNTPVTAASAPARK